MIRRSPCELYIKYLLAHPDRYELRAIRHIVRGQQLDYPNDDYVESLKSRLRLPTPFYPSNKYHKRSHLFLMQHKLLGFFHPDAGCRAAHELLRNARAKELIETMTIAGDPPPIIAHRLQDVGISSSTLSVERYCQFYWNIRLVDQTELRALIRMRVDSTAYRDDGAMPTNDQLLQSRALAKVRYQDPRSMILSMPVTPLAGMMNQIRMGLMPERVEFARLASAAKAAATVRVLEQMLDGGPMAAVRGRDYALVAKTMGEMLDEMGSPDAELQKELQQLKLQTDTGRVPHVGELPGDYAVEMEPTKREVIDVEPE